MLDKKSCQLEDLSAFADDNYTIKWHQNIEILIANLDNSLSTIVKWLLTDWGLKVNEEKT